MSVSGATFCPNNAPRQWQILDSIDQFDLINVAEPSLVLGFSEQVEAGSPGCTKLPFALSPSFFLLRHIGCNREKDKTHPIGRFVNELMHFSFIIQ